MESLWFCCSRDRSWTEAGPIVVMPDYLVYHPPRQTEQFGRLRVHFDAPRGNQDPYIWNQRFLHSYCHITQLSAPNPGDRIFWVSSTNFRTLPDLLCDLVFIVEERVYWENSAAVSRQGLVAGSDSEYAYADHYRWATQHVLTRRRRYTLKANARTSFQPQNADGTLLDIRPMLLQLGVSQDQLLHMLATRGSKPLKLSPAIAQELYRTICKAASKKLHGATLARIRASHPQLCSPWP